MPKIIGNTTATPNPRPDWEQKDEAKADFIKNKPKILTEDDVVELIIEKGGGSPENYVTAEQFNAALGAYITDIDTLIGGV